MNTRRGGKGMSAVACPACRSTEVGIELRQVSQTSKGRSVNFWEEVSRCARCGEEFYTREQSLASSQAYAAAVGKAEGLVSPGAIREARQKLRMTQEQFEEALGVGKKTVVRWERGTVAPGPGANGLLWLAARYPGVFLEYVRERSPKQRESETGGRIIAHIQQAPSETSPPKAVRFERSEKVGKVEGKISGDKGTILETGSTS